MGSGLSSIIFGGSTGSAPEPIKSKALDGIESIAETKKPRQMLVSDYLATLNRRDRREFARLNGIFVPGSQVPITNTRKAT